MHSRRQILYYMYEFSSIFPSLAISLPVCICVCVCECVFNSLQNVDLIAQHQNLRYQTQKLNAPNGDTGTN